MRRCLAAAVLAQATFALGSSAADDDEDLELIPEQVLEEPAQAASSPERSATQPMFAGRFFLEDAFTLSSSPRSVPVPYPGPLVSWRNRLSFDVSVRWAPWKALVFSLSNRLSVFEGDGIPLFSSAPVRNAFREGYATWQPIDHTYLEVGRINVRKGVALGFNPTDFFKTRTLVGQASLDPSVLRQNRLGTLMARWQAIWKGGSASIAFAPRVTESYGVTQNDPSPIDPRFDATNDAHRLLCSLEFDVLDASPEILAYFELHRIKLGLNLSRPMGDAVVGYAEWAGGLQPNLITRAVESGQATGTLPPVALILPPTKTSTEFQNDVVAGFSWTVATALTLNLEYHFHQAGFARQDWRNWFDSGNAPDADPSRTAGLWYVRAYASDRQEPVSMHQLFVRASWPRALVTDLELGAFAFIEPLERSSLMQLSASYYLSDAWTASSYVSANVGAPRSEHGSFPQRVNFILQLTRYL